MVLLYREHKGPSTFNVVVLARPGKDLKEVEKAVYAELDKAKAEPIPDWELEKVRMMERRQTAQELQRTLYRAYIMRTFSSSQSGNRGPTFQLPSNVGCASTTTLKVMDPCAPRWGRTAFKDELLVLHQALIERRRLTFAQGG